MRTAKQKCTRSSQFRLLPATTGTWLWVTAIAVAPFLTGCKRDPAPSAPAQAPIAVSPSMHEPTLCPKKNNTTAAGAQAPIPIANSSGPTWLSQNTPPAQVALVFVHGIFGDAMDTWTNANGTCFFDLVHNNKQMGKAVDIFTFGFTSNMVKPGSQGISDAAIALHQYLGFHKVLAYPAVVYVAHSMGGLVVLKALIDHPEMREQVPGMMFYATPQEGADITNIGRYVLNNPALEEMLPPPLDKYLDGLDAQWRLLPQKERPPIRCAYETKPIGPFLIVPKRSATLYCDGELVGITGENHLGIVKPDRWDHPSVVALVNALHEFGIDTTQFAGRLATPDLRQTGPDDLMYTLTSPTNPGLVRFINEGKRGLRYQLTDFSEPPLNVSPWAYPRVLPGETTDYLKFMPYWGVNANEYSFVLRADGSPPKKVIVKVDDPQGLLKQQAMVAQQITAKVSALLTAPKPNPNWGTVEGRAMAQEDIVRVAKETVQKANPDLPEFGQWVITANVMSAVNWPELSVLALRNAERASPEGIKAPAVQRLAGIAAHQSGITEVFANAKTPLVSGPPDIKLSPLKSNPFLMPDSTKSSLELADQLVQYPGLKTLGLSLRGDVQLIQGNEGDARRAYMEANAITPSPSIDRRTLAITKIDLLKPSVENVGIDKSAPKPNLNTPNR